MRDAAEGVTDGRWLRIFQVSSLEGNRPPKAHQLRVEALSVARVLLDMQHSGTHVFDKDTKMHRALRWGDIAIISRAWSSLDPYSDALASLGIPHVHMGGGNLMDTREARDGYVLLRFLADPRDDLASLRCLRAPSSP